MVVRVQTNGQKTPVAAMEHALDDLNAEFNTILNAFNEGSRQADAAGNTYS